MRNLRRSTGERIFDTINVIVLALIAFCCLAPLTHVLFASLSHPTALAMQRGLFFYPKDLTLKGYELVFRNSNILYGYLNTLLYVAAGTTINLVLNTLGGFVLSRRKVLWSKALILLIVFTMFFREGLIPFYILMNKLNMVNTRWSVIIPRAARVWYIIIIRTYFQGIPDSLEESAKIDGANALTILLRIMVPLAKPVLAVIVLFCAVDHWNGWFYAMIFLRNRDHFPLQLFLREILVMNDTSSMITQGYIDYSEMDIYKPLVKHATTMVATLPILFVYPFLQKHFVKGVMIGSLKG